MTTTAEPTSPDTAGPAVFDAPSARAAFDAVGLDARRWPSFEKALTSLAAGEFIVPEDHS